MKARPVLHTIVPSLMCVGLTLAGCQSQTEAPKAPESAEPSRPIESSPTPEAASASSQPSSKDPGAANEAAASTASSLAQLHPIIREQSEQGLPPEHVVVELSRRVVARQGSDVGQTKLTFEPEVEGTLRYRGQSTLVFTPSSGWKTNTEYRVTLEALQTQDGLLKAEASYTRVFRTPRFSMVRADLTHVDARRNRATVELVFSAPVSARDVSRRVKFTTSGGTVISARFSRGKTSNVARAVLTGSQLVPGIGLHVRLADGLKAKGEDSAAAPATDRRLEIPAGKAMKIFAAHMEEGTNGFFVRVVCTDDAFSNRRMYFWDKKTRNSWRVSQRCILDEEDAKDSLHFDPPVKYSLSPTRGGFRILGDFARGSYSMRLDADARTSDGGVLQATFSETFSVPARKAQVAFLSQGRYLPKEAWKNLGMRHMNLDQVTLEVRKVGAANLVHWMSAQNENADTRNSDLILKEKINLSGTPDTLTTSWINVARLLPKAPRGVLALTLYDKDRRTQATARILVTDINLVAKHQAGDDRTRVWALDMHSGEPVSGVDVEQVVKSGRVISRCTTQGATGCLLDGVAKEAVDTAKPFALIAQKGKDLTYLVYDELRSTPDAAQVHGRPYKTKAPYSAAIYSDRGVYRPGETAHVVAVVRDQAHVAPPEGMPVSIELVDPRSKIAKRYTQKTNSAGMVSIDLKFADYADTGAYAVRVSAGKKRIAQYSFNVEEFVPERMRVKSTPVAKDLLRSQSGEVQVDAQYLFGGSAEGSRFEVRCELAPARFKPELNGQYEYGVWHEKPPRALALGSASGTLDTKGLGTLACPSLTGRGGFAGPARLDVNVAVFESGSGRTTQTQTRAWVHPAKHYVGLMTGTKKLEAGKTARVKGVVVDWTGKPINAVDKVTVRYYRVEREHDWVYDSAEGRWTYRQYSRLAKDGEQIAKVKNGSFSANFTPTENSAAFVVRVEAGEARADLKLQGNRPYWWSWHQSSGQDRTPRPLKPATLPVKVPKQVKVGEEFTVTFTPPFKGQALIALETDHVVSYEWMAVEAKPTTWTSKLPKFAPNVYASVFVVKDPHLESRKAFLPNRAFGVRSIKVRPEAFVQPLSMKTPEEVRSNSPLKVELDFGTLEAPMFVSVAAVDEGILQLTKFKSPDPLAAIFDKRALGTETFETIGWNVLLPAGDAGRTSGGDADSGAPGRVKAIKPVALWAGLKQVPKSGKLTLTFDVPQYRGSLRVMAVAAGQRRMGSASQNVTVRDPLVVQTTLPRFLTDKDEAEVPVFVTNLSGSRRSIKVRVEAKMLPVGGLHVADDLQTKDVIAVLGTPERSLVLDHEKSGTVVFKLQARQPVGAATLKVVVQSDDLLSEESLDVPFLPAAPKSRVVQRIELKGGELDLLPLLSGWMPTTEKSSFWVTANPYGDAFDHLKYLIRYPYGCIEQTTSSTRPLLFVGQLMTSVDPTLMADGRLEKMVMHGVNRVLSMQTPEGGFSYWPGGRQPVPWGTAYGLHMLLDAQKQRYPVPQERINDALSWVERTLSSRYTSRRTRDWYYGRQSEAYLHYVLALAGRARKARIIKLLGEVDQDKSYRYRGQRAEDVYMLQAALHMAGDHRFEKTLRNPDTSPLTADRHNSWSFYSDRRRRGFMLSTYTDLFGADAAGEPLAQLVAEGLRGHRSGWYTTQELVWGITGLGKYIGEVTKGFKPARLIANGKAISAQDIEVKKAAGDKDSKDTGERTWSLYRASEYRSLKLDVKKEAEQRIFLIVSSEGVRQGATYETGGAGLGLSRSYRNASGELIELTDGSLSLGDVVYAVVEVHNETAERMQNIAVVDRFPAGWEIENPRLSRGGGAIDWVDRNDLWTVDYMNLRDDRVELFGTLNARKRRTFVYALRAVTAGRFTMPPVEAEAMYDPSRWAREAGGPVVISGPWDSAGE